MNSSRAFTLIELLVVIAIIAILGAILFPVFARVREKAHITSCASNMRQLGMAVQEYSQDADEQFPAATGGPAGEGLTGGWMFITTFVGAPPPVKDSFDPTRGSIYPYIVNSGIYVCPDDAAGEITRDSYAINGCLVASVSPGLFAGEALNAVDSPTSIMLFCEESVTPKLDTTNDAFENLQAGDTLSSRHNGGQNIDFVDGHVKWSRVSDIHHLGMQTGVADETTSTACPR